jgi:hypothetical protein
MVNRVQYDFYRKQQIAQHAQAEKEYREAPRLGNFPRLDLQLDKVQCDCTDSKPWSYCYCTGGCKPTEDSLC